MCKTSIYALQYHFFALIQDESRNISENPTCGTSRKFEQGKVVVNHKKFLGYDKDEEGNLIINEKHAKIVRRIYTDFLDGKSPNQIARELENEGVLNWNGKDKWYESTLRRMLSNEKYEGDALLQKTYTVDFLTKKRVENNGEVPQYYVEDSYPAIIEKEMWEAVQLEIERRRKFAEGQGNIRMLRKSIWKKGIYTKLLYMFSIFWLKIRTSLCENGRSFWKATTCFKVVK